ncbi:MAG: Ig-like domain-containing protein [Scytonema sp. PMC 1069.18]|nr:Ig-like domain-containing protein [Scytonema sp. PMC 1069.18]MEC4883404.1 Ig-like domain-containing protein [Scytonema sp. PMC 1070.18]
MTKSNTTKSQDLLTGGTKDEPIVGTKALDPLLASSQNSLLSLPVTIDVIPPLLTVTALPVELVPGSPSARLVGVVNGTGSAIASLSVQIDDLVATPVSISPLGTFDHLLNFTGLNSGSHTLKVNATDSAGNISYASFSLTLNLSPTPPAILAALANDTAPSGTTNSDRITSDPTLIGTVKATQRGLYIDVLTGSTPQVNATGNVSITETNHIVSLKAGFNNTPVGSFTDIKADLKSDGSFTLNRTRLDAIYGGSLPDSQHTLHIQAVDKYGVLNNFDVAFTLDTTTKAPTLNLLADSDSGVSNSDRITNNVKPTITGTAEALATVKLFGDGQFIGQTVAASDGTWQLTTPQLADGVHSLGAIATDIAGNTSTNATELQVTVDSTAPQLNLTNPVERASLRPGDKLSGSVNGTGSPVTSLSYRFDNQQPVAVSFSSTGTFDQILDVTGLGNGEHTLTITTTDTAGNVTTSSINVTVIFDKEPPVIAAGLMRDTAPNGTTNSDLITFDPTIRGTVTDASRVVELRAGLDNTPSANFVDVTALLQADSSFTFNRAQLESISGGILPDSVHTLHLQALDEYGYQSNVFDFTFTLDTALSAPIFNLEAASDSGTLGDKKTKFETVTLVGQTEANATVVLEQTLAVTTSDSTGKFAFANISLAIGDNPFTVRATDIAGNEKTFSTTIYRLSPPTAITLVGDAVAENSAPGTVIGELSFPDPDSGDSYTYTLVDDGGGRFRIVGNQLLVANGQLLNFESNSEHSITVRSTDASGLSKTEIFTIGVTNVNESPIFTSTPFYTANEGSTYTYNIATIDPDVGDTRNITASNLPTWLNLVDNGDGAATLSGTPTQGIFNIDLAATDAAGFKGTQSFIISVNPVNSDEPLVEETNFTATRSVNFTTGATPSVISFKIDPEFDNQDPNSINDAFEVALVDVNGNTLVHTVASGRDAFFNWTEGEEIALGAGTSYHATDRRVSLNLTGIAPNTDAKLVFRLVNNDGDTTTSVRISDFVITPAPEGTQIPLQKDFEKQPMQGATPNFNLLSDVSQSFGVEYHRTTFNADTKLLYADIAVRNAGSYSIDAPVLVGITNISDPSVIVRNFDGLTPEGIPYYDFSSLVADSKLDPNELTAQRSLVFYNPLGVQFTYDVVVLAQLNKAPVIETKPNTEIIGGQSYRYDVNATDPNSDVLTYKLLVSPEGMTIDAKTGVITWDTVATNKGNHAVYLEVSDSRGGVTTQQWTLSVIDAPPNRPPIFTSTPVVDAAINTPYQYDADAIDLDADNLTYKLALGPDGMTVDPTTGEVKWTPPSVMVFGDTVLGRINNPGEQDAFTFSMVSGQRIYFDSLKFSGNYWEWAVRIYSPSGQLVVNSDARYEGPLNLTETGNYCLVIDGNGSATGDYGFSLLDLDVVPIAPMDSNVTGVLNPGSEADAYRFTGTAGQRLYFDRLSHNTNLDWVLYDAGNQVIFSNNWNDMEIELPVDGEYILALKGKDNFNRNVPYTFRIITPDTNTASLTLGSNDTPHVISDAISEKGEQDVYTFSGSIGQRLSFDTITNGYYTTRAYLYSPSGITIFNRDLSEQNVGPFTLTENGTYRLVIDGNGEQTDAYSFSMLDVGLAPTIALDTERSGQLDPGQRTHFYQFEGTAGQQLFFDSLKDVPNTSWDLVGPGNQVIHSTSISYDFEVALAFTGTYTLAIYGFDGNQVDYQFQVITPDTNTTSLTLGSNDTPHIISDAISEKGEQDVYTFSGSIGQRLSFDTITNGYYTTRAYLYSPSGITIFNRDLSEQNVGPFTLTENGTYRLVIDGNGEQTDAYSFSMLDVGLDNQIALDTDISGQLDPGQRTHFYQFEGTAGERLYLDSLTDAPNTYWDLVGPGDGIVRNTHISSDFEATLHSTGTYTLAIYGFNDRPVDYKFRVITPDTQSETLIFNNTVSGEITEKGEQDVYTFNGTLGQRLYFDPYNGSSNIAIQLVDPSGFEVTSGNTSSDSAPIVLRETGTYRLIIDGHGDTTGNYGFRLVNIASGASSLTLGTPTSGSIAANETQLYSINGSVGQRLKFDSLMVTENADWVLYAPGTLPSGHLVVGSASLSDDFEVLLPASGIYTLALRNLDSHAVSHNIQVTNIASSSGTNSGLGTIRSGNISTGQQINHTFTARAGTFVYFDSHLTYDYYHGVTASLLDPTNNIVVDSFNVSADRGLIQLQRSGMYTVQLSGDGNYRYQMIDLGASSNLSLNTITNVSLNPGEAARTYKFTGVVGQKLFYDALNTDNPNVRVSLFTPNGRQLFNVAANSDAWPYTLDEAGTYYLLLSGNEAVATTVSFRLFDQTSATPIALDTDVTGSFAPEGINSLLYRFNGTAGQSLYVDQQVGGFPNKWYLYAPGGQMVIDAWVYEDGALTLPSTGEYLLAFAGNGASDVNYKFRLVTPEFVTTPLTLNQKVNGNISEPGENDTYTFSGTVGQQLYFDALNTNDPNFTVRLYTPSGRELYSGPLQNDRGPDTITNKYGVFPGFTLTETGTYRLVIDANGDATGNYNFQLLNKADATVINLDTDISGTFADNGIESHAYRFNATASV